MDAPPSHLDSARSWVVVGAAFISTFTVFGVVYSFGAFFDSMAAEFGIGRGATALMFSITTALYFTLGLVTGRLADRDLADLDRRRHLARPQLDHHLPRELDLGPNCATYGIGSDRCRLQVCPDGDTVGGLV